MFGSVLLEVVVGLVLLFLVLSMMASAVNEVLSNFLRTRSKYLEKFIRQLLEADGKVEDFYNCTSINSGLENQYRPSYIKREYFAEAVLDIVSDPQATAVEIRASISTLPEDSPLRRVLTTAVDRAGDDAGRIKAELADWFDSQMDRVSGWYVRRTKWVLIGIGILVALALNIDTIKITNALLQSPTLRASIVAQAEVYAANAVAPTPIPTFAPETTTGDAGAEATAEPGDPAGSQENNSNPVQTLIGLQEELDKLNLPIGWAEFSDPAITKDLNYWVAKIIGILITALAVSQGAPFWFDLLNRVTNLRSTSRPPEEKDPTAKKG